MTMRRISLTSFDDMPESMRLYLRHYGPHFNRKLCAFAVSKMEKAGGEKLTPYSKEQVRVLLDSAGITLDNDQLHDSVYVANMCKADFLGSSIADERSLAKYVKDVIDDPDGYDGVVFNRWYADMCYCGIPIEWEEML